MLLVIIIGCASSGWGTKVTGDILGGVAVGGCAIAGGYGWIP